MNKILIAFLVSLLSSCYVVKENPKLGYVIDYQTLDTIDYREVIHNAKTCNCGETSYFLYSSARDNFPHSQDAYINGKRYNLWISQNDTSYLFNSSTTDYQLINSGCKDTMKITICKRWSNNRR